MSDINTYQEAQWWMTIVKNAQNGDIISQEYLEIENHRRKENNLLMVEQELALFATRLKEKTMKKPIKR